MHTPAGPEHDDEFVDSLLERLEALAAAHCSSSFDALVAGDAELAKILADDPKLAAHLDRQLQVLRQVGGLFSSPADQDGLPSLAGYQVLSRLGHGGAGVVYRARQLSLGREVALKVMLGGRFASERAKLRFRLEAETAARLQHPHIAQIYDHGEFDGLPYLSQELLSGGSLAERIARELPSCAEAAEIVESLARAVHYAHLSGVIHRDLKPGNVLLTEVGEPKIVDFGLAKALDFDNRLTQTGEMPGTPSYMPPEQIQGGEVGPPADVYGLGAILYELLTGEPPFTGANAVAVYSKVQKEPAVFASKVTRRIPLDLRSIVLCCLEKDPRQRYKSAAALADDLRRWSQGLPVEARPLGAPTRVVRWTKRRPATAALIGVSLAAVVALLTGSLVYSIRLARALEFAQQQQTAAERRQEEIERQREELAHLLYLADMPRVQTAIDRNNLAFAREVLMRHEPKPGEADLRSFPWYLLDHMCHSERFCLRGHNQDVYSVVYSPDGRLLASSGQDGTVRLWQAADGKPIAILRGNPGELQCLAFSPDGKTLASGDNQGALLLWPVDQIVRSHRENPQSRPVQASAAIAPQTIDLSPNSVWSVDFSSDSTRLAIGLNRQLIVYDLPTNSRIRSWDGFDRDLRSVAFAEGDRKVYFSCFAKVQSADIPSGELQPATVGHSDEISVMALSKNGELLASADQKGGVQFWNTATGVTLPDRFSGTERIDGLDFSFDGKLLAIAGKTRSIDIWDIESGSLTLSLQGHAALIWSATFSPDGTHLASASADGTVRIWRIQSVCPRVFPGKNAADLCIAFAPDVSRLAIGSENGRIRVVDWSKEGSKPIFEIDTTLLSKASLSKTAAAAAGAAIAGMEYSHDGTELFALNRDGYLDRWDAATGAHRGRLAVLPGNGSGITRSPGDDTVAVWSDWEMSRVVDPIRGQLWPLCLPQFGSKGMIFSNDGGELSTIGWPGGRFSKFRPTDGAVSHQWSIPSETAIKIASSHNEDWIVTGGNGLDRALHIFDARSGKQLASFVGHESEIRAIAVCRDGQTIASGGDDAAIRLWDISSQQELLTLKPGIVSVKQLKFSTNGRALGAVGTNADGTATARVWYSKQRVPWRTVSGSAVSHLAPSTVETLPEDGSDAVPLKPEDLANLQMTAFIQYQAIARGRAALRSPEPPLVTFEERIHDGAVEVACLVVPGVVEQIHNSHEVELSKGIDRLMSLTMANGELAVPFDTHLLARTYSAYHLPQESVELRQVVIDNLAPGLDILHRFRSVHRWAKDNGYVGGFPSFDDEERDGKWHYGVLLIKPGHGREVWMPIAGPVVP